MEQRSEQPVQPVAPLSQFARLVGEWAMVGTHPAFESAVHGHATFEWLLDGALMRWRFDWEQPGPPSAISVIGRDDAFETCSVLYADERGITRIYQMSLEGDIWRMWRDAPGFAQRMTSTFNEHGNTMTSQGELSRDGAAWEPDLKVVYTKIR